MSKWNCFLNVNTVKHISRRSLLECAVYYTPGASKRLAFGARAFLCRPGGERRQRARPALSHGIQRIAANRQLGHETTHEEGGRKHRPRSVNPSRCRQGLTLPWTAVLYNRHEAGSY